MENKRSQVLQKARRVIIKVGSSLLTGGKSSGIQKAFLGRLAKQVQELQADGIQCVIVTSGAIAAGFFELGLKKRPKEIAKLQALAALGQSSLMHAYKISFNRFGLKVAQVLLTREDLSSRNRYSNAHHTLEELFHNGIVPVINENDTVAVEEIKFGDNDTLGVLVTHLAEGDLLVLLTDTDGFFEEDPRVNPKAKLILDVFRMEAQMEKNASASGNSLGTGGMITKIQAAKGMMQSGIPMVIANGRTKNVLVRLLDGEPIGTFFHPPVSRMNSRKRWLAWSVKPQGEITVDGGAEKALLEGNKSLLPSGVREVSGHWGGGAIVRVVGTRGQDIAKGIVNYSSSELSQVKGLRTAEIRQKRGADFPEEVIHRDNMVKAEIF